jgi:hypothetical protein
MNRNPFQYNCLLPHLNLLSPLVANGDQLSISPTSYARLFCTKVFVKLLCAYIRFEIFWRKRAHEMLVKLTQGWTTFPQSQIALECQNVMLVENALLRE